MLKTILNLVSNAIKFTKLGLHYIHAVSRQDHVEISISDNGIGIKRKKKESSLKYRHI
jgi:signal transduction histidine kinase